MTYRDDATPLSITDRFELVKTSIDMIDSGLEFMIEVAVDEGAEITDEFMATVEDMRADSYISMLWTMVNDPEEARVIIDLLSHESK